jgi:regulator of sigma E protease
LEMPVVIGILEPDSPASKAGLQVGDRIIRVDNKDNPNWEDWRFKEVLNSQASLNLLIERGDKTLPFSLRPETRDGDPFVGIGPEERNVSVVEPNMPAAKAGMLEGDEIVAMNGIPMHSMVSIRDFTKSNGDKPMTVTVLRQGTNLDLSLTPVLDTTKGEKTFRMGIASSRPTKIERLPFAQAFPLALDTSRKFSFLIVETVKKLVERKVSLKQMDGPVGMARATGAAASQKGWTPLATLMALISLNLGIFNLLPIPILDGGLILLTFIESIIRRDIDQRVKERIYQTAFVFLVIFAVTVVYNDVSKIPSLTKFLP